MSITHIHPVYKRIISVLLTLCIVTTSPLILAAQEIALPDMGGVAGAVMTPAQERELGESLMRRLRNQLTIIEDPEIQAYVQALGYRLAAQGENHLHDFNFFVINDKSINAFAIPGGFIGINTGLILASQSEHELASVVAHEIAHITQRHIMRIITKTERLSIPATVALLAALLVGSQNSELGAAALMTTLAGTAQAQINFTREHEKEADRIGIRILARAGFDPNSMPDFFERLQQASRYYGGKNAYEFLSTHPVTLSRIADTRNRAAQYPYRQTHDSLEFDLVRAKLRIAAENNANKSLLRTQKALQEKRYRIKAAAQYEHTLALIAAGKYQEANVNIKSLLKSDPDRITYLITSAQIAASTGRTGKALRTYQQALDVYPHNLPLTIRYSETLLQSGKPDKAASILRTQIRHSPDEPVVHKLLARAEGESHRPGESHLAMAQYYYLNGNTGAAIHQLKLAQQVKNKDFYLASRVEARIRELEQEQSREKDQGK